MSQYKIAVFGDRDCVMGFKALGLGTFAPDGDTNIRESFRRLASSGEYAIIYVTESFAKELSADIEKYKSSTSPAVILIPGRDGSLGIGLSQLSNVVERAVGINIL